MFLDTIVLWTGMFRRVFTFIVDGRYDMRVATHCSFFYFLYFSAAYYSVYLLVAVTVDRFISIYLPIRSKQLCTLRNAKIVVVIILVVDLAFHSQWFYFYKNIRKNGKLTCSRSTADEHVQNLMRSIIYCLIPFIIMIVLNTLIIVKMYNGKHQASQGKLITSTLLTYKACHNFFIYILALYTLNHGHTGYTSLAWSMPCQKNHTIYPTPTHPLSHKCQNNWSLYFTYDAKNVLQFLLIFAHDPI